MSKPSVELGRVGIWYGGIDALPTPEARRAAQVVEELGYGALWVAEAVGRDPFVSAAVLLGATERLAVATGIANIYARDPMTMKAGQQTLAEAFPDRFLLGLGVSHGHLVAGIRKHDYSKPYSYMVEYLDKMDKALFMAKGPEDDGGRLLAALGPAHPDTLSRRNTFARASESAGDLGRAIPLYEQTLTDSERVLGPDHPDTLHSRGNLAVALWRNGERQSALEMME